MRLERQESCTPCLERDIRSGDRTERRYLPVHGQRNDVGPIKRQPPNDPDMGHHYVPGPAQPLIPLQRRRWDFVGNYRRRHGHGGDSHDHGSEWALPVDCGGWERRSGRLCADSARKWQYHALGRGHFRVPSGRCSGFRGGRPGIRADPERPHLCRGRRTRQYRDWPLQTPTTRRPRFPFSLQTAPA